MLQLPDTTFAAHHTAHCSGETRLGRVMARMEETLALLFEAEDRVELAPQQRALYDQYDALIDEAACLLPTTEEEAVFLFILAGAEGDMIANGSAKYSRSYAELRQRTLFTAALTFFDSRHREIAPKTWEQFTCHPSVLPRLVERLAPLKRRA